MNYSEFKLREKQLKDKLNKLHLDYFKENTRLKIGDEVEYIKYEEYFRGPINDFRIFDDGRIGVYIVYGESFIDYTEVKLFNETDYELRKEVFSIELDVGDKFVLLKEKPKTTLYSTYIVHQKIETEEYIEYTFYNDSDKPTTLYEDEYVIANHYTTIKEK